MMRIERVLCAILVAASVAALEGQGAVTGDAIKTSRGDLVIHPVNHASFVMAWQGKTVYVDPVGGGERYAQLPRPDVVFITDIHGDHMHPDTLNALVTPGTKIVAPAAVRDALPEPLKPRISVLANGEKTTVDGVAAEAVPMYNTTPERAQYHTKGRGNGYVLTFGDKRVYIAGDTEPTPEMLALTNIDVAFIPMNLPYTMTVQQAAEAVRKFRPKIVYPYHSRGSDVNEFARLVGSDSGIDVRIRTWY
jgi:L-ascorbate metabolism protein UlaG (beta-lactamase superfamily)